MSATQRLNAAYIADLVEHPQRHELRKIVGDQALSDFAKKVSQGHSLTWANVFDAFSLSDDAPIYADDEWFLWQDEAFWGNFSRVVPLIDDQPRALSNLLIKRVGEDSVAPVRFLDKFKQTQLLFEPTLWGGDLSAFNKVWFVLDRQNLGGVAKLHEIRRSICQAAGKEYYQDLNDVLGFSNYEEIYSDIAHGRLDKVLHAFDKAKKPVGIDLMVGPYSTTGEVVFDQKQSWSHFSKLAKALVDRHVQLEADALTFSCQKDYSIAEKAENFGTLGLLFEPELWVDNLENMAETYRFLENKKAQPKPFTLPRAGEEAPKKESSEEFNFNDAFLSAAILTFSKNFSLTEDFTKEDLFTPVEIEHAGYKVAVKPVTTPIIWEKITEILEHLEAKDSCLKLEDLLGQKDDNGHGILQLMARFSGFETMLSHVTQQGDRLSFADLCAPDDQGITILDELRKSDQLATLLCPKQWFGHDQEYDQFSQSLSEQEKTALKLPVFEGKISILKMRDYVRQTQEAAKVQFHLQSTETQNLERRAHVRPS